MLCPKCDADCEDDRQFCSACGTNLTVFRESAEESRAKEVIAGSFELIEEIGRGAMGAIYRATQRSLSKTVVVKLLHRHLLTDPTVSRRFYLEARAASLLQHPNVINVIDYGQADDGSLFIAMEHVDGVDLAELLATDFPIEPPRIIRIAKQICLALDEAHAAGVIHRDLKPENIMIEQRRNDPDHVKVLDFGIAKIQGQPEGLQTVAGLVCGTPEFMAPEQARAEPLDARCDLYAFGVILYQLLTSELPFAGESPIAVATQHLTQPVVPPSVRVDGVHLGLEALVLHLMAKAPCDRPSSAMEVYATLELLEDAEAEPAALPVLPARPAPYRLAAAVAFACLVCAAVAVGLLTSRSTVTPSPTTAPIASAAATELAEEPQLRRPQSKGARALRRPSAVAAERSSVSYPRLAIGHARIARRTLAAHKPPAPRTPAVRRAAAARIVTSSVQNPPRVSTEPTSSVAATSQLADTLTEAKAAKRAGKWRLAANHYRTAFRLAPKRVYLKEAGFAQLKSGDRTAGCASLRRYVSGLTGSALANTLERLSFFGCDLQG